MRKNSDILPVHGDCGCQGDERVDGEEKALLLVRLGPEDAQPKEEAAQGQPFRDEERASGRILTRTPGRGRDQKVDQEQSGVDQQGQDKRHVEVQDTIEKVVGPRLSALIEMANRMKFRIKHKKCSKLTVEVWSVIGENVVSNNVKRSDGQFPVELSVDQDLWNENCEDGDDAPPDEENQATTTENYVHGDGHSDQGREGPTARK